MRVFHGHCGLNLMIVGAMVVGGAHIARAENEASQLERKLIQIASEDGQSKVFVLTTDGNAAAESSDSSDKPDAAPEKATYWVGILGGPVPPELRAQID